MDSKIKKVIVTNGCSIYSVEAETITEHKFDLATIYKSRDNAYEQAVKYGKKMAKLFEAEYVYVD